MKSKLFFALLLTILVALLASCTLDTLIPDSLPIGGSQGADVPESGQTNTEQNNGQIQEPSPTAMTFAEAYQKAVSLGFTDTSERFASLIGIEGIADGTSSVAIADVTAADGGKLLITLTDQTTLDPIDLNPEPEHQHALITVTTAPTCTSEGYDTITCEGCDYSEITNRIPMNGHDFSLPYSYDGSHHWLDCQNCEQTNAYGEHATDGSGVCSTCGKRMYTEGIVYQINGNVAEVRGYSGTDTDIVIADTYEGVPVRSIRSRAFQNATITSVTIPASIEIINSHAFSSCRSLVSVTFAKNGALTTIDSDAFYYCLNLTHVEIPDSVTSIGDRAFSHCSALATLTFTQNSALTHIGYSAFRKSKLTSLTLPASVNSIAAAAFYECSDLISINVDANNPYFTSVDGNLYSKDEKTLVQYLLAKAAEAFVIPESVTKIGDYAFALNQNLKNVTIPDGVTVIGEYAFYSCQFLTGITIPASVQSIGESAFNSCYALATLTLASDGALTTIGNSAFCVCIKLTSVTIPTSVQTIADSAFTDSGLTTLTLPSDGALTTIGMCAFSGCKMTEVIIPASVQSLGSQAFYSCHKLVSVTFAPNSAITAINSETFRYCSVFASITIPASVTSIGNGAFSSTALTTITIPASVTSIGNNAFANCHKLESITLSEGLKSIGNYAFNYCDKLTSITIPASVESLGNYIFDHCLILSVVTFAPSSELISIGDYAFSYCYALTDFTIPASVQKLGKFIFDFSHNLTSVTFENPTGWWITLFENNPMGDDLSESDLADATTALTYLTTTYKRYYWRRTDLQA